MTLASWSCTSHQAYTRNKPAFDNAASSGLLAGFGYDADKLAAERAKIEAFDAAHQAQEAAKGAAQHYT